MAVPAFRSASYAGDASSPYRDVSVTQPSGTAENDVLIGVMQVGTSSGSVTLPPSGWTQIDKSSNTGQTTIAFWKRATASEPATYDFNMNVGGGSALAMGIAAYSGCITTGTPFESASLISAAAAETTPDTATISTSGDDRLVINVCAIEDNVLFSSAYPPSGWTHSFTATDAGGSDLGIAFMERAEASATTVSQTAVGTLPSSEWWHSLTLALIPEPSGTTHNPEVSVTASSTATFDVSLTKQPAVSATGSASATFALALTKFPEVSATGSSTATFDVTVTSVVAHEVAFDATGSSTATFAPTLTKFPDFAATGSSTATFGVSKVVDTEASVTGSSTATFALSRTAGAATTIAGLSTADFDLDLNLFPQVAATGSSTATFDVTRVGASVDPEVASAGAATAVFGLTVDRGCELSVAGNASCQFDVTGGEDADQTSLLPLVGAGT